MKALASALILAIALCISCKFKDEEYETENTRSSAIIQTLRKQDRNSVYVALWTLQQNGIQDLPSIDLEKPYSEVAPKINKICELLQSLSEHRLKELDESLVYHWKIYSPIYLPTDDYWSQKKLVEPQR